MQRLGRGISKYMKKNKEEEKDEHWEYMPDVSAGNGPEGLIVDEISKRFKKGILNDAAKNDVHVFFQQFDDVYKHLSLQFEFLEELNQSVKGTLPKSNTMKPTLSKMPTNLNYTDTNRTLESSQTTNKSGDQSFSKS